MEFAIPLIIMIASGVWIYKKSSFEKKDKNNQSQETKQNKE
ncbi:hypothetical protein [Psychrobium sp. 1_MG-2023]|nr:hypothetical protein [Psychrobium sp. 1_MG-2023]MDP2562597.1 hypothetical protein [Psychrobium sp. 1_MG-2023]